MTTESMGTQERFLITGGLGCIGAWVVRNLLHEGAPVTIFDLASNPHRLKLILTPPEIDAIQFLYGDISDLQSVKTALQTSGATHIIHLAALQVPFCKADPSQGARVNVVGTVNLFEAAKQAGIQRIVYASSVAVYGLSEEYPEGEILDNAPLSPRSHYGVYKQANEGTARIYWLDDGVSSIGLRPYTLYGPGRDQGMTSGPTKAMLAAAAGQAYHIPFGGRNGMQYTDDVAKIFIQAARVAFEGAHVFNLRGSIVSMTEIIAAIEAAEPSVKGKITFEPKPLALPEGADDSALRNLLGSLPDTPFKEGVKATVELFKQALADGRISISSS
jgi:UDP-glucuronate 4-epimerase